MKNLKMKLQELDSVKRIADWTNQGINNVPDESQVGRFVREIIPYVEQLEKTVQDLEDRVKSLERKTSGIIQNNIRY